MVTFQNCPPDEKLAAFAEGRLDLVTRQELLSHLDQCDTCREITAANLSFLDAEEGEMALPASHAKTLTLRTMTAIAVPIAAVFLIAVVFVFQARQAEQHYQQAVDVAQLAMNDSRAIAAPMASRFRLSLAPSTDIVPDPKRGLSLNMKANRELAIEELMRYQEDSKFQREAGLHLVTLYLLKLQFSQALKTASDLRLQFDSDPDVLSLETLTRYLMAHSRQRLEDQQQAIADLEHLHQRFPKHAATAYNLGMLYFENKRESEAAQIWDSYRKLEPDSPFAAFANQLLSR